jgi:hypothetical protein
MWKRNFPLGKWHALPSGSLRATRCQWLKPIILATWKAERILVQGQLRQIFSETSPSPK